MHMNVILIWLLNNVWQHSVAVAQLELQQTNATINA